MSDRHRSGRRRRLRRRARAIARVIDRELRQLGHDAALGDQPGMFEYFEVPRHGGQAYLERRGKLVDGRLALRQPREDGAAGRVCQCREGNA